MSGLRIALVGPQSPPAGGMARQRETLIENLRAEGLVVQPVAVNPPYSPRWVRRVPILRAMARLGPYLLALWRVCGKVDVMHVMANSGWSFHLFATPAVWVARMRGVPVVMSYHGGLAQAFFEKQMRLVRGTLRRVTLIVPSEFLQSVFARFGFSAQVVPNSVALPVGAPDEARTRAAHVVVVRHLEKLYDIATAVRAFAILSQSVRDARLTIAGSGVEQAALIALVQCLGLRDQVRFVGQLDKAAMQALYQSADVMVNPSLADNLPNCILEAWAFGVPVVSTNVGGVPWMAKNGHTALLVPPGAVEAMADAIRRAVEDASLARRLIANGVARVTQYRWASVGPRLIGVYREVVVRGRA
ncbi:MAG: hypothetical protein RIR70_1978 [Pseudomonadota bacterium]|jgi:glycosyltransferase involved in cell wall biosynthesis